MRFTNTHNTVGRERTESEGEGEGESALTRDLQLRRGDVAGEHGDLSAGTAAARAAALVVVDVLHTDNLHVLNVHTANACEKHSVKKTDALDRERGGDGVTLLAFDKVGGYEPLGSSEPGVAGARACGRTLREKSRIKKRVSRESERLVR